MGDFKETLLQRWPLDAQVDQVVACQFTGSQDRRDGWPRGRCCTGGVVVFRLGGCTAGNELSLRQARDLRARRQPWSAPRRPRSARGACRSRRSCRRSRMPTRSASFSASAMSWVARTMRSPAGLQLAHQLVQLDPGGTSKPAVGSSRKMTGGGAPRQRQGQAALLAGRKLKVLVFLFSPRPSRSRRSRRGATPW